ncbi:hypothetical protein ABEB36_013009 [Hypothenemus hampei]|uniref:Uncharacterized protein n=1 Tax=Hypothenemus hampei TaxID=57062 RepID=A0ABD1E8L5_HYPHA
MFPIDISIIRYKADPEDYDPLHELSGSSKNKPVFTSTPLQGDAGSIVRTLSGSWKVVSNLNGTHLKNNIAQGAEKRNGSRKRYRENNTSGSEDSKNKIPLEIKLSENSSITNGHSSYSSKENLIFIEKTHKKRKRNDSLTPITRRNLRSSHNHTRIFKEERNNETFFTLLGLPINEKLNLTGTSLNNLKEKNRNVTKLVKDDELIVENQITQQKPIKDEPDIDLYIHIKSEDNLLETDLYSNSLENSKHIKKSRRKGRPRRSSKQWQSSNFSIIKSEPENLEDWSVNNSFRKTLPSSSQFLNSNQTNSLLKSSNDDIKLPILVRETDEQEQFQAAFPQNNSRLDLNTPRNNKSIKVEVPYPVLPLQFSSDDSKDCKASISQNYLYTSLSYSLGNMVWAQVGKFPYWPAIICKEPDTEKIYNLVEIKNRPKQVYYHLRFFGDYGRRAWVNKNRLILYYSGQDLEIIGKSIKLEYKANRISKYCVVPYKYQKKWKKAVEEVESYKNKSLEEILEYLLDCYKRHKSIHKNKSNRKSNILNENEKTAAILESKKIKVEIEFNKEPALKDVNITNSQASEYPARRSTRNIKTVNRLDMLDLQENKNCSRLIEVFNSTSEPIAREEEMANDLIIESVPKTVSNLDPNCSFEYQSELHRRNNLFNGLRLARVCDHCLKQGDIYKCKGKCGGSFHLECASQLNQSKIVKPSQKPKSPEKNKPKKKNSERSPLKRNVDGRVTRSQSQIITVLPKENPVQDVKLESNLLEELSNLSITEQIDFRMKEMMSKLGNQSAYQELTDSSSEEGSSVNLIYDNKTSANVYEGVSIKNSNQHVTADFDIILEKVSLDANSFKCIYCLNDKTPPCYFCGLEVSKYGETSRQKCSLYRCSRYYHLHCLKMLPQTQWSIGKWSKNQSPEESFTCPAHRCHTCFSEELGSSTSCRLPGDRLARCMLCPAAFHSSTFCTPAGSEILGGSQIICPRHRPKQVQPINTVWCFICSQGGKLICCDTCPTSVHPECQPINYSDDDKYICEDCESGRFPLYDEVVWVKLGAYRWWPALILFPNEVPDNVRMVKHQRGDFVVRFFGTNDYYWVNKLRSFAFQEDDKGSGTTEMVKPQRRLHQLFHKAIEDAAVAYKCKKEFKMRLEAEVAHDLKPPFFVKINKNKPVGNVKIVELDLSNANPCECDPNGPYPCGPSTNCINRLLMTECDPAVCNAGTRCRNQSFQKREYPPIAPYKTQGRGWGLKTLAPIQTGQFVIEYVGELIDSEEYQRRIRKMHEKKEENYYFMTVDSERMIDAGHKGNLSRFMNHSCNPNCITQKWTVQGDTRVGLFAKCDIEAGSELTFNYYLEVVGQEKKVCKCGADNCSGFIGVKVKMEKVDKQHSENVTEPKKIKKVKKQVPERTTIVDLPLCFVCNKKNSVVVCSNKFCNKAYHLDCLDLKQMPSDVHKFVCSRHNCNICSHRTIRCCVKCINSFCPSHSAGNVRYDDNLGFICWLHDPVLLSKNKPIKVIKSKKLRKKLKRFNGIQTKPKGKLRQIKNTKNKIKNQPNGSLKLKTFNSEDKTEELSNSWITDDGTSITEEPDLMDCATGLDELNLYERLQRTRNKNYC